MNIFYEALKETIKNFTGFFNKRILAIFLSLIVIGFLSFALVMLVNVIFNNDAVTLLATMFVPASLMLFVISYLSNLDKLGYFK